MDKENTTAAPRRSFVEPTAPVRKPRPTPQSQEEMPLFKKMDKMIETLDVIAYQLTRIADNLTGKKSRYDDEGKVQPMAGTPTPFSVTAPTPTPAPQPTKTPAPDSSKLQKIIDLIPSRFQSKLEFVKRENDVRVNVREYLPSEDFARIAGIFRDVNGTYVSAGKDSHFIVPFLTEKAKESPKEMTSTAFPKDLREMLTFEETGEYTIIKPRQYLGSENFAKIASVVRELGGEYISAGKESHFRVKK